MLEHRRSASPHDSGLQPPLPPALGREYDDFDELSEEFAGWDLDFRQVSGGPFRARRTQFGAELTVLARGWAGRALEQRGATPREPGCSWCRLVTAHHSCSAVYGSPGDVGVTRPGEEYDVLSQDGFSVAALVVSEEHLARAAGSWRFLSGTSPNPTGSLGATRRGSRR